MGIGKLTLGQSYAEMYLKNVDTSSYQTYKNATLPMVENKKNLDAGVALEHTEEEKDKKVDKKAEKKAKKNQKNYEKNKERIENSDSTVTYIDKKAYKAAEKDRKKAEKELVKKYREEGHSKKEAKQMAKDELGHNKYIKNKNTKKFINANQELFFDENGNYSADKTRKFARDCANISTDRDENGNLLEVENGYLSLKERRDAAAKYGVKDDVIADIAKNTGHGYEKDNTEIYRAAYVTGMTVTGGLIGFGLGSLSKAKATANAKADAVVKDELGNVIASNSNVATAVAVATARVPGVIVGAAAGLGLGLGTMHKIKDKGGVEPKIYDPNPPKVEEQPDEHITPHDEDEEQPERCILQPDEQTFDDFTDEETCSYTLRKAKNGKYETLYDAVRDGYGLKDHKEIMKFVHVIKDRYKIPYNVIPTRTTWEMPEIEGRKFKCDVDVTPTGNKQADKNKKVKTFKDNGFNANKVNNPFTKYWYEDCSGNKSEMYDDAETRNKKMAEKQAEIDAQ